MSHRERGSIPACNHESLLQTQIHIHIIFSIVLILLSCDGSTYTLNVLTCGPYLPSLERIISHLINIAKHIELLNKYTDILNN